MLGDAQVGPIYLGVTGVASLICGFIAFEIIGLNMWASVNWNIVQFIRQLPWLALEPPAPGYGLHFPPLAQGGWWLMAGFFLTASILLWWVRVYTRARSLGLGSHVAWAFAAAIWPSYLLLMAYVARQAPWPRSVAILVSAALAGVSLAVLAHGLRNAHAGETGDEAAQADHGTDRALRHGVGGERIEICRPALMRGGGQTDDQYGHPDPGHGRGGKDRDHAHGADQKRAFSSRVQAPTGTDQPA